MPEPDIFDEIYANKKKLLALTGLVGLGAWAASRFKVSGPSQYIVRTGLGIKDISVTKTAVQWPMQTATKMSIEPVTFPIEIDAMSKQRIPFTMPTVWTIGPRNEPEALANYARLLMDKGENGVKLTMEGVIQGETRVLTANLDLNNLFADRDEFKADVVDKINNVVEPFGLVVYNANIAELRDLDEANQYFSEQKRRALQRVNQEARVNVAEAIRDGAVGEAEHQSSSRQGVATAEKEAKLVEYQRDQEIAESLKELEVAKAEYAKETEVARIQAKASAETRRWELQMAVEEKRKEQEIERRRAEEYTTATVQAEVTVREAEGRAEAVKLEAEAKLYAKQMEAKGVLALREAEAEGLRQLIQSAGDVDGLNRYVMVRDGVLPRLAEEQARALQGLNPRVSVWNTGQTENSGLSRTFTDLFRTGMPLFDGIREQTGYDFMKSFGVQRTSTEDSVEIETKET